MPDQDHIDGLHQRAAENYLQGQFEQALESWRELLEHDPRDERAIEGIRLCELIVQQASSNDFDDLPAEPAEPAAGDRSDVDFDEIERILKESETEEGDGEDDPGWDLSALDAGGAAGGLDLGDLPDLETQPQPAAADPLGLDAIDLSGRAETVADPSSAIADAAAAEIQSRVADLLAQASTSYDAGDIEGAMTLLERVFQLDEENAAARALAEAFRSDIDSRGTGPQAGEGPVPDSVADDGLEGLALAAPAAAQGPAADASQEPHEGDLVATPPEVGTADEPFRDPSDYERAEEEALTDAGPPAVPAAAGSAPGRRKPVLIGIAVVVVLAGAAALGFKLRSPGKTPASEPPPPKPLQHAIDEPLPELPLDANAQPTAGDDVIAELEPPDVNLDEILKRARAAFEGGDFSQAVVAYNEALQLDPGNRAAQRGLTAAGAAYQEQREFMAKLDGAAEAFGRGDFHEALRVFYRLPGTEGVERFDRFKAHAWYNIAVNSLKMGACSEAGTNAAEAGTLLPDDPAVQKIEKLARACSSSLSDPIWLGDVQRLQLRDLDD